MSTSLEHSNQGGESNTRDQDQPKKRRRIAIACKTCRRRKSKCDGARPKCSICREFGYACVYERSTLYSNKSGSKDQIIRELEKRLESVEEFLEPLRQEQCQRPTASTSYGNNLIEGAQLSDTLPAERISSEHTSARSVNAGAPEIGEIDTSENAVDGMGAMQFTDEEDCGFYGPTSNIAFMRHISRAISRANSESIDPRSPSSNGQMGGGIMSVSKSQRNQTDHHNDNQTRKGNGVNIYALPLEERTWELIRKYFLKTGQLIPFVHEKSFCETYFEMKRSNFTKVRKTWLGLLNIILAMGATLSIEGTMSSEQRIKESDIYYQRANGLCDKESRRTISLEMVQYLLILGQYLQGTQKSVQAWTVRSLAITAAYQLGLHSRVANQGFPPLESELRKRTWFGCVMLDRTLSMTFGRPCAIPESYVKLELPSTNVQMLGQESLVEVSPQLDGSFLIATIKLYVIMYNIIDSSYGQNLGFEEFPSDIEVMSRVMKGEAELATWSAELQVSSMIHVHNEAFQKQQLEMMDEQDLIFERFNIVLSLRYHNLRILLHRQFLEKSLDEYGGRNAENTVILQQVQIRSIQKCVESAMVIISLVHAVTSSSGWRRDLLGAWNFSLYYTFNAGLVIFSALLISNQDRRSSPTQWALVEKSKGYLDMAIEALQNLDRGNRVIERCMQHLSQLSVVLVALTSDHEYLPSNTANISVIPTSTARWQSQTPMTGQVSTTGLGFDSNSPFNMDFSEFMLESEVDFVGRLFDQNRPL